MRNSIRTSLLLLPLIALVAFAPKGRSIDIAKSKVTWHASKVTGSHDGNVSIKSGKLEMKGDELAAVEVVMDMTSITCTDITSEASNAKLVNHLKSADFFDVENHPTATFKSTSIKKGEQNEKGSIIHIITGDLTIKGITQPVTFDARYIIADQRYTGTLTFDRTKYDIKYRSGAFFPEIGDKMIYDEVRLDLDIRTK